MGPWLLQAQWSITFNKVQSHDKKLPIKSMNVFYFQLMNQRSVRRLIFLQNFALILPEILDGTKEAFNKI